jgi:glutamate synthase (NADPH/NADH) large chain
MITNTQRAVGAMLSYEISKKFGEEGLPEDTIVVDFVGSAGQSFGAFLANGVTFNLSGDANDYVGKCLSGGKIIISPSPDSTIIPEKNIIAGNVILYGATGGKIFLRGLVGERFCVRNSGCDAVVEGVGDHGCEYMTGGIIVVLGKTGRNFAAGMSGGIAYVLDEEGTFPQLCNLSMVELEPIPEEDDLMESEQHQSGDIEHHGRVHLSNDMTRHDDERLRFLIERHATFTKSNKAFEILSNWENFRPKFVKVMPTEYRRALQEIQEEQEATGFAAE